MERVRSLAGGQNFAWERSCAEHVGPRPCHISQPWMTMHGEVFWRLRGQVPAQHVAGGNAAWGATDSWRLHISFPIVLWYQHSWENEIKKSRLGQPKLLSDLPSAPWNCAKDILRGFVRAQAWLCLRLPATRHAVRV